MRFLLLLLLSIILLSGVAYAQDSWALVDQDIAGVLTWDEVAATSVTANNDSGTAWDSSYALESVEGITPSATAIDRWGNSSVAVSGSVAAGGDYTFDFNILAPPITTLMYPNPETPTAPGVIAGFDNNWMMANTGTLIQTDVAAQSTVIERFPDIGPDEPIAASSAYAFQIEQLGGRVPLIAQGYSDGTYRPLVGVNRGAMAVYIQRALAFPLGTYDGRFTDVALDFVQAPQIMACVDNGIVQGYADNTYHPERPVNRGQMAIFVARGLAGGDEYVPSGPSTPTFSDVGTGDQPYKYVEYSVANNVVQGYNDGTYRPTSAVTRGQMAVYIYRAFIQPTGAIVVLAGPGLTAVDPGTAGYNGWSTTNASAGGDAGDAFAYVGFDAMRFKDDMADFDVEFALYDVFPITGSPVASQTVTVDVSAALAAVDPNAPYTYASWDVSGVADGHYYLQTIIDGEESGRYPEIWIGAPAAPVTLDAVWDGDPATGETYTAAGDGIVGDHTIVSGSLESDMATKDGVAFSTERNTFPDDAWCDWNMGDAIAFRDVPADATTLSIDLTYRLTVNAFNLENSCCDQWGGPAGDGVNVKAGNVINCCDSWGYLDDWDGHTSEYNCELGNAPMGWGVRVMSTPGGGLTWQTQWWDNDDGVLEGSGDKNMPADNDFQGGGEMYNHVGFTGNQNTYADYQWGTYHAQNYITDSGSVIVVWCGGSWTQTDVDYAKLTVGFGAPPLF